MSGDGRTGSRESGADPLRRSAARRPEAPAVDGPKASWSYRRLDREAAAAARRVRGALGADAAEPSPRTADRTGVPRVAAFLPRRPASLAVLHGVPRAGAALAPLHRGWAERELAAYLRRLEPDLLIAPAAELGRAEDAAREVPTLPLRPQPGRRADAAARTSPGRAGPDARSGAADPAAVHSLVATSGSTGTPRPVRLTLGNHLASARGCARRLDLAPEDRWYASLSLAHVGGLALAVRAAVVGATVVARGAFDADETSRLVDRGRITHASLVPVTLRRLLDAREGRAPPSSFRCVLVGGAATPDDLLRRALSAELPVSLTYGLSEACSQVATAPPELVRRKPGTVGPTLAGVELRIAERGEIRVRGATVSPGYLDGEPATADGWLRTGDAGRVDDEGHLWVTGRLSDRIVTGGTTVHPAEIEDALLEHPGVREAAAVGVPSEEWGEVVGAAVVTSASGPDREALDAHCRRRLSSPRRPRRWLLADRLPRLAGGKTDRSAVRARLRRDGDEPSR